MRNYPPGPPMTLGNMRELGVQRLVAFGLNDACIRYFLLTPERTTREAEKYFP
jgi:hypothetical protein